MGLKDLLKKIVWKGTVHSKEDPIGAELKPIEPIKPPFDPTNPIPVPKPIKPKEEDK